MPRWNMGRMKKGKNVYELVCDRLDMIFSEFDNVCVSFSGGKDSGVLLNLCIDYIRKNNLPSKLCVFHMDYEVQYDETTRFVDRIFADNADVLDVYRICVPFKVTTCTSMFQTYWRPWSEADRDLWVRPLPEKCYTKKDFPFFNEDMWDYDFQSQFAQWLHEQKKAIRTCCLIGIRTQESLNRWRAIHTAGDNLRNYRRQRWTRKIGHDIYNAYPIFDWLTTDIWVANGKFHWDYNHLYDLFYKAGVPLDRQRVASPFITSAKSSLWLYRVIDPNMWGKMINRVNGVNFSGIYNNTSAAGHYIQLPEGFTWESYMHFLLSTLPEKTRLNYQQKLSTSMNFWREKGGCLSDETIEKLKKAGIEITVGEKSNYKTTKKPVRMEYQDDIDIAEFKDLPTFKRICICILKNDHACKYMGFSLTKEYREQVKRIMEQFK